MAKAKLLFWRTDMMLTIFRNVANGLQLVEFTGPFQHAFQLQIVVEMIFDNAFIAVCYKNNIPDFSRG